MYFSSGTPLNWIVSDTELSIDSRKLGGKHGGKPKSYIKGGSLKLVSIPKFSSHLNIFKIYRKLLRGGCKGVRKSQNRVKKRKKPQYRTEIYQNTETVVTNVLRCRHHYLLLAIPLEIRPYLV